VHAQMRELKELGERRGQAPQAEAGGGVAR
jgi:hypothetical protein